MSKKILRIIILAAGKGSRMESNIPKVLHKLSGQPIIKYVVNTAKSFNPDIINLIYGYKKDLFNCIANDHLINLVFQKKQLGTGHAIKQVLPQFSDTEEDVLILYGDMPLISINTLRILYKKKPKNGICLLTKKSNKPDNYGRIIRKNGSVIGIVEHKDASSVELLIKEINTGIFIANSNDLKRWIKKIKNNNSQKEYYITDIINFAYEEKKIINTVNPIYDYEIKGINNFLDLSCIERIYQKIQIKKLLLSGVKIEDPKRFDLRGKITYGKDIIIDVNVIIEGQVILGNNIKIGAGCIIKNSIIGDNCVIKPYSIIKYSKILNNCIVGPFAILRKKSQLESGVEIGNFVEIKKSVLGNKSKVKHFSYLGDAKIGKKVNIGAGTVTCNFNGINKHNTIIGDNVFIGSTTQLIAPINISKNSTTAAGTTVMKNVSSYALVYNPKHQCQKFNWKGPKNK